LHQAASEGIIRADATQELANPVLSTRRRGDGLSADV
jgi:hypothetical protein